MKKLLSIALLIFGLAFLMPPPTFAAPDNDQGISFVLNVDHFTPAAVVAQEIGGVWLVQCLNSTPTESVNTLSVNENYTAESRLFSYNYTPLIEDSDNPLIRNSGFKEPTINHQKNYCSIQIRADSRLF